MTTDTQRLQWLLKNVTYLEHPVTGRQGGYWPQSTHPDFNPCDTAIEELVGLELVDYIDEMIRSEK